MSFFMKEVLRGVMCISTRRGDQYGIDGRGIGERSRDLHTIDDGTLAVRWYDHVEYIAVLPENYEAYNWDYYEEDDMNILDSGFMEDNK
ncbi:MAG: hypothetical protein ACKPKO_58235 [Candidatus Fonsibacter sp.]